MIPRCAVCGNRSITTKFYLPIRRKLYCSKECMQIANRKNFLFIGIFGLAITLTGSISIISINIGGDPLLLVGPIMLLVFAGVLCSYMFSKYLKGRQLTKTRVIESENKIYSCIFCNHEYNDRISGTPNKCHNCGKESPLCDICSEYIFAGELVYQIQECGHIFHKPDLLDYLEKEVTCPKCKKEISSFSLEIK